METIHYILEVFRYYESYFMILLTSGYFIATIFIFRANQKSADMLSDQIELQKEQWFYEETRKAEIKILLDYYTIFIDASTAIAWFSRDYCHPFTTPKHHLQYNVFGVDCKHRKATYMKHKKVLNNLNNAMNRHLIIFKKHNLTYNAQFLWCFLATPEPADISTVVRDGMPFFEFNNIHEIRSCVIKEANKIIQCDSVWKAYSDDEMSSMMNNYGYYLDEISKGLAQLQRDLEFILFKIKPENIDNKQKIGGRVFCLGIDDENQFIAPYPKNE